MTAVIAQLQLHFVIDQPPIELERAVAGLWFSVNMGGSKGLRRRMGDGLPTFGSKSSTKSAGRLRSILAAGNGLATALFTALRAGLAWR